MFFWNSLAFSMIQWMLAIGSLIPVPFLNSAWTSGSSWFMYCWSLAWRILSIILLACEMSAIVQQFEHSLALPFFGTGMKTDLFKSCGHCWVSRFAGILSAVVQQWLHGIGVASGREEKPQVQGQRNPSKTLGEVNLYLESNPIPARDTKRAQTTAQSHSSHTPVK